MNRFAGAKARTRHVPGTMNKTEARFAEYLQFRKLAREIVAWGFEEMTLKLAKDCRFTPDFWALNMDGEFELIEVKAGKWGKAKDETGASVRTGKTKALIEDDSRVKLATAGNKFPFRFTMAFEDKATKAWIFEDFTQWENA
tara:strand:+ start:27 stop:452 length:426 start_codon:yes stop_codon:yes gene_type:complete